ncbi:MAG: arylesterase [Desulfovibrio sp.]|nr:arylesterase [Desulfovibrio sp.]MCA1986572.1 arylesterase [Desulfovibrio sp.]
MNDFTQGNQGKARPLRLLALGDSLTAGWGLPPEAAFPVVLEQRLRAEGWNVSVVNAGVSGDTTTGGLNRLPWLLEERWDGAILELGANDMLRGEDPAIVEANLSSMLELFRQKGIPVLLAGMRSLSNFGEDYTREFDGIFPRLAEEFDVVLYPFFLEGVAGDASLNLPDGLHPNQAGIEKIAAGIHPKVVELLQRVQ